MSAIQAQSGRSQKEDGGEPTDGNDELGLDSGEDLVTLARKVDHDPSVDSHSHQTKEGAGRVAVEQDGEKVADKAVVGAQDPVVGKELDGQNGQGHGAKDHVRRGQGHDEGGGDVNPGPLVLEDGQDGGQVHDQAAEADAGGKGAGHQAVQGREGAGNVATMFTHVVTWSSFEIDSSRTAGNVNETIDNDKLQLLW